MNDNDIRKQINSNKPLMLYGYNRGFQYYEINNKHYELSKDYKKASVMNLFISLIVDLKKVNDTIYITDLGLHILIRNKLLKIAKSFGVKNITYESAVFDNGDIKVV